MIRLTSYETGEKIFVDPTKINYVQTLCGITNIFFSTSHLAVREQPFVVSNLIIKAKKLYA